MPRVSDPAICAVCAGRGNGVGFHVPGRKFHPLWVCDDPQCLQIAKATYSMSQHDFDRIERMAQAEGGRAMEEYCDAIGKTDFAQFTQSEFDEALYHVFGRYRASLVGKLRDEAPF